MGYYSLAEKLTFAASKVELLDVDILRALQGRSDASASMPRPPTPPALNNNNNNNDEHNGDGEYSDKIVDIDDGALNVSDAILQSKSEGITNGLAMPTSPSSSSKTTPKKTSSTTPSTPHSHRKSAFHKIGFGFSSNS